MVKNQERVLSDGRRVTIYLDILLMINWRVMEFIISKRGSYIKDCFRMGENKERVLLLSMMVITMRLTLIIIELLIVQH